MGLTDTKHLFFYLILKINWMPSVLSGNPTYNENVD